jgi:hypothetical protein
MGNTQTYPGKFGHLLATLKQKGIIQSVTEKYIHGAKYRRIDFVYAGSKYAVMTNDIEIIALDHNHKQWTFKTLDGFYNGLSRHVKTGLWVIV